MRAKKNEMFQNSRQSQKLPPKLIFPPKNISRQIYFSSKNQKLYFFLKLPKFESDFEIYFYLGLQKHH